MTSVCVTGASGFIASHIVAQLLEKGYTVKATVRDASDAKKTAHLTNLCGAAERLQLFSVNLMGEPDRFDECIAGCVAIFHTATPVVMGAGADGKAQIYEPAMKSTEELLTAITKAGTIKLFVLTSSMSAVAPQPEPAVKTEEHWSDDAAQEAKNNWYGCTKTRQEKLVQATLAGSGVRYAAICPTGVFGPMLQPSVNATMNWVASMTKGPKNGKCGNDSMSFVDVRDCAAMHVAALEKPEAAGRYICVAGTATERRTEGGAVVYASTHWNDVYTIVREICPQMPPFEPCDGEPVVRAQHGYFAFAEKCAPRSASPCRKASALAFDQVPTSFDLTKMNTLLPVSEMRGVRQILSDAIADLKAKGVVQ
ncbi:hypothetical protein EMIHUDRAFT_443348 [Emiliania huxleyi CCMP1516]|uniref:NAD-dependent epimerase/dehydratase domain-containing protein n=2 Tax=Emiliania huxleyi TaxID=2903 RepID=A0A0D3JTK9_EMIH1|nr:hypothetical protein EMIHUDRAFT_443348 [Emiliania huxleyi CCMP1516]EOD26844.1 hypothetical protein EMIHUDRAFT_443348 [Emiliania huxleyi CCMP1516]|eukprot:XP_005779273.1 hypothetical protein EMIHUDRAFT_443348 [Emiliania huxleyi CCMP1516]